MRKLLRSGWMIVLLSAACATSPKPAAATPAEGAPRAERPADLDQRLDRLAERSVQETIHEAPVPQLPPQPPEGGRPAGLEEVTIVSDGLSLRAWLVPPAKPPARATVLVLPGWASNVELALDQSRFLLAHGYRLLLLDPRANLFFGRAQEFRGFLEEDLRDVGAALAWLRSRKDVDVSLLAVYGFSWGGLKAVLSGQRFPELRAVVDDAGPLAWFAFMQTFLDYAPPSVRGDEAVVRDYLARVDAVMKRELGYGLEAHDSERAAAALAPRPLLVIHSDDDGMVPMVAAQKHFAAAGEPKRFLHGKDFGHCLGMKKNPGAYEPVVVEFLDGVFAK